MAEDGVLAQLLAAPVRCLTAARRPVLLLGAARPPPPPAGCAPPSSATPSAISRRLVLQVNAATAATAALLVAGCIYSRRQDALALVAAAATAAAVDPYLNPVRPQYRLYTMAPLWNLPTYHPASLKIQAYMRFLKPDQPYFETDATSATHISPEHTLPVLVRIKSGDDTADSAGLGEGELVAGSGPIIDFLAAQAKRPGTADGLVALTPVQAADMEAYISLVENKLYLAMIFEAWAVPATYSGITKPAIAEAFPFPLSMYLPILMKWRNVQRCERSKVDTPKRAERAARSSLAALEVRLGSQDYFFGAEPSALDATVYGYLETIYRQPFNGCWEVETPGAPRDLRELLLTYPNLMGLRERITERFFKAHIPKAGELPPLPEPVDKDLADEAAAAAAAAAKPPPSEEEIAQWEEAKCWMGGATALLGTYVLTSTDWLGDDDDDEYED